MEAITSIITVGLVAAYIYLAEVTIKVIGIGMRAWRAHNNTKG
jgi:hypothetical protein